MNRQIRFFALLLAMIFVVWSMAACAPSPARRPIDYDGNNNYRNYNQGMDNTPDVARDNQNKTDSEANNNQTSSLFSKLDYSFATITDNVNIRSGPNPATSVVGNLKEGDVVKVIGKLNDWYVVNVPNTNKLGCISPNYTKLYSAQPGTTKPSPTKPIPTTPTDTNNNVGTNAPANQGGTTPGANAPSTTTGSGTLSSQGSRILQLANAERAKVGAKPLKVNAELNKLANMKSQDMVEKNYFSHQSPTYGSPFDMMKTYGIEYMYAGENLAINRDADRAHNAWMNSEGHRKNILNPDFTEIGIGLYPKGDGSYVYTQMFIGK